MRELAGARIGCAMTGSFCTFRAAFDAWRALKQTGAEMYPIFSENAYSFDTRFYTAERRAKRCAKFAGATFGIRLWRWSRLGRKSCWTF